MTNLIIEDYNKELLIEETKIFLKEVLSKAGEYKFQLIIKNVIPNSQLIDALNKAKEEDGMVPNADIGFFHPIIGSVLTNCNKLSAFIEHLDKEKRTKTPPNVLLNLKLLVYLQVIETKYLHKVLVNSLKILLDEEPDYEIFDDYTSTTNVNNFIGELHTRLRCKVKEYKIIKKWLDLFDKDLRNKIAHNDYYIEDNLKRITIPSSYTTSLKSQDPIPIKKYSYDAIDLLYRCSKSFNEAFYDCIDNIGNLLLQNDF
jgi:hypothetical protein